MMEGLFSRARAERAAAPEPARTRSVGRPADSTGGGLS